MEAVEDVLGPGLYSEVALHEADKDAEVGGGAAHGNLAEGSLLVVLPAELAKFR